MLFSELLSQNFEDKKFKIERMTDCYFAVFQLYYGKNKLHLMRRGLICTRPTNLVGCL